MLVDIIDALRRGDRAAALANARATLAEEPGNAAAHHLLGVCLQQQGELAGAGEAFERALELGPDVAAHHFSLATLRLAQGDAAAAIRGLHEALALDPNQIGAYVLLAHLALGRGDQDEAVRQLRLAQRVSAEHPQVRVLEGYVARAQGDEDKALKCFTAAAEADPNLAAAQLALGQAYLARRMWPFAEKALENSLRLDPSRAPGTLRGLIEARRRQGKGDETLAAIAELLALEPGDLVARGLRAEILASAGRAEEALADLQAVLAEHPAHPPTVNQAVLLLGALGRGEEAVALAEAALQAAPTDDNLWRSRLAAGGAAGEDAATVLERWEAACPASAVCLDMRAAYHDARREADEAIAFAERALAIDPALYASGLVKIRQAFPDDPAAVLERADAMLAAPRPVLAQRTLLGWRGLALDTLGRHDEAGASWREMVRRAPEGQVPLPPVMPADEAPAGQAAGTLLWSPPGVRAEFVLRSAKEQLGKRLRLDRIGTPGADDGFGLLRFRPGHENAGTAERWNAAMQAAGLDPAEAIDWLPHADGYTYAALGGAPWLVMLVDPRDALINWMVHGSLQNFRFPPDVDNAAEWLAQSLEALADQHEREPGRFTLVQLDGDAGAAAAQIEKSLGLAQPLPGVLGRGSRFPTGHWRQYGQAFAAAFARLSAVAQRLGYPAG